MQRGKTRPNMTYNVFVGTLNLTELQRCPLAGCRLEPRLCLLSSPSPNSDTALPVYIYTHGRGTDAVTTIDSIELEQMFALITWRAADAADWLFEVGRRHTLSPTDTHIIVTVTVIVPRRAGGRRPL